MTAIRLAHLRDVALVLASTAAAFGLASLPGAASFGPLVLALLLGAALASTPFAREARLGERPAVRFHAKTVLRVGIVLLGVRLDVRVLLELGPVALMGSALGVLTALLAVEFIGRAAGLPAPLRRAIAVGTAICGASAIAAALPLLKARAEHASLAIATISLVGTAAVLGFSAWNTFASTSSAQLALLAGGTLQEVGHVVAAGQALGADEGERALLVKLARVILLAPTLLVLGWLSRRDGERVDGKPTPWIPAFVVGFLAMSAIASLGILPGPVIRTIAALGVVATAAAMTAIGFAVDVRVLRTSGRGAFVVGIAGFAVLLAVMTGYYAVFAT